jgi:hypothetical protein
VNFIPGLVAFQQTPDVTAGLAARLPVVRSYDLPGIEEDAATELQIAAEAATWPEA